MQSDYAGKTSHKIILPLLAERGEGRGEESKINPSTLHLWRDEIKRNLTKLDKNQTGESRVQIKEIFRLLKRWWRSPLSRNYELQLSPIYWLLKRSLWFSKFQVRKVGFKAKSSFRNSVEAGSLLGQVVRQILLRVFTTVLVVVVLVLIEHWGRNKNLFFLRHVMDENAQLIFLSSLGAVAAAFVGLYFTAISIIASSATYARAPDEIHTLIMKELADNFYFKVLAQFAGIVVIMLTALALKWPIIGPLITCVVTLLCLFSIFSFFVLLSRVFRFSDPNTLTVPLNRDLIRWIQLATPAGYQWRDGNSVLSAC
jgi:hypothetical protein